MKNKGLYLLLLCVLLSRPVAWGQDTPDAARVMDSCVKRVKDMDSYRAVIEYDSPYMEGRATLVFSGGKYVFSTESMERMCDGKYIYTVMNDVKEVNVENIETEGEALGSMSDILNIFVRNFKPYAAYRKGDVWVLVLRPMAQDRNLMCVDVEIDAVTYMPRVFVEKMKEGEGSVIKILEIGQVKGIDENRFTFDEKKYEDMGYYIVRP